MINRRSLTLGVTSLITVPTLVKAVPLQPAPEWNKFNLKDTSTWPTIPGVYAVMVSGDSESIDGHTIYAFDDYRTFANLITSDPEDGEKGFINFHGYHDEDEYTIFAWYGPIIIPEHDL